MDARSVNEGVSTTLGPDGTIAQIPFPQPKSDSLPPQLLQGLCMIQTTNRNAPRLNGGFFAFLQSSFRPIIALLIFSTTLLEDTLTEISKMRCQDPKNYFSKSVAEPALQARPAFFPIPCWTFFFPPNLPLNAYSEPGTGPGPGKPQMKITQVLLSTGDRQQGPQKKEREQPTCH